jgi:hypothetical protein
LILPALFSVFAYLAALATLGIASVAVFEIGRGLLIFGVSELQGPGPEGHGHVVVASTLKGIELLFLSPMPYLIVRAIGDYLKHVIARRPETNDAPHELKALKVMTTTLMIAVVATDLVQRTLAPGDLTPATALYESLVILVLSLYIVVLERSPRA